MDRIFDLGNLFNLSSGNFFPALLIPAVFAVLCALALFLFNSLKAESPKFRKISGQSVGNVKKKKRNAGAEGTLAAVSKPAKTVVQQHSKMAKNVVKRKKNTAVASKSATDMPPKKSGTKKPKLGPVVPAKASKSKEIKKGCNKVSTLEADSDAGGEWQTVIPKKQKKHTDHLIQPVAQKAAVAVKKNPPKKKENPKGKRVELEAPREEYTPSVPAANAASKHEVETSTDKLAGGPAVPAEAPASQIVFDELADADCTESKPQKKYKKRALRE